MFKVVPDQLRVAQGWVRCGQCGEVFEASFHLVPDPTAKPDALSPGHEAVSSPDPTEIAPPQATPEPLNFSAFPQGDLAQHRIETLGNAFAREPVFVQALENQQTTFQEADAEMWAAPEQPAHPAWTDEAGAVVQTDASPITHAPTVPATQAPERIEPTFTGDADAFRPVDSAPSVAEADTLTVDTPAHTAPHAAEPQPTDDDLSFIRDAHRKAFWKQPMVRTVLGLLFIVLLAALTLQWMVRQKDVLAAQEPRLAPLLQALCRPLGCEIRPLRRIESVRIDSANFSKSGPDAYRLSFVLKNTGAVALEIPALEVTLTDSRDQALVRRVLLPAQFGVTATTLRAHSELAGTVALTLAGDGGEAAAASPQAGALPVAGYRMLAFYP